jgi:hypothetical protein
VLTRPGHPDNDLGTLSRRPASRNDAGLARHGFYALAVIEGGSRVRNQPAPPHVIFEALTDPDRDPMRPWLILLGDEQRPRVIEQDEPHQLLWSSLWVERPDARVRFDLSPEVSGGGTQLRWTLFLDEPLPVHSLLGHLRKRLNLLINGNPGTRSGSSRPTR